MGRLVAGYKSHFHQRNITDIEDAMRARFSRLSSQVLFPLVPFFRISVWRKRPSK